MQKLIFLIIALCFFEIAAVNAQTEKGKIMVGSSSTLSIFGRGESFLSAGALNIKSVSDLSDDDEGDKVSTFQISPKVGYGIIDNLFAGLSINFYHQKQTIEFFEEELETNLNLIAAGPYLRYYIPVSNFSVYLEAGSKFGSSTISDGEEEVKSSLINLSGMAGVAFPLGKRANFDAGLTYQNLSEEPTEDNPNNAKTIYSYFGLDVGLTFFFGGAKE